MRFAMRWLPVFVAAISLSIVGPARAENEGQEDLSDALEKKLSADSLADLNKIIDLCDDAIKKGLDETNAKLAKNLITSTLLQRATLRVNSLGGEQRSSFGRVRQQALVDLEKALQNDPKLAQAHLLVARLQSLPPGDQVAAEKSAEKALEYAGDDAETKIGALALLAQVTEEIAKKFDYLNQAAKIAPNNPAVLSTRGALYLATGKTAEAIADLQAVAKADPKNAEAQGALGLALLAAKRSDEAAEIFTAIIDRNPDEPGPYLSRARAYLQGRRYGKAIDDLDIALKQAPSHPRILLLRALANHGAGNAEAAKTDLDDALKDPRGLQELNVISLGRRSDIAEDLESLTKIAPKNSELLLQLGMLYLGTNQPRKAIEKCTAALEQEPENFMALRTRADALLGIGKHPEAVADYERAVKLKSRLSSDLEKTSWTGVLNNFAWVLATSPEDSVRDGKRAIDLATQACDETNYSKSHILSTLAASYAETGNWEKAIEWSKKAAELGHEDEDTEGQLKKELASYEAKKPWREKQEQKDEPPAESGADEKTSQADSAAK
jgi:tetratricopeptide (TPR) repeat protein